MTAHDFTSKHRPNTHQRELERTLRRALSLAGGTWAAERAMTRTSMPTHRSRTLRRLAGHLIGYGALAGYILRQRERAPKSA